ncbi:MAG: hypothetical protein ACI4QN_03880 [Candidatus Coproplasma sp.]
MVSVNIRSVFNTNRFSKYLPSGVDNYVVIVGFSNGHSRSPDPACKLTERVVFLFNMENGISVSNCTVNLCN